MRWWYAVHDAARAYVAEVTGAQPWRRVVEIGGRDINGGVRDLLAVQEYLCCDLYAGPGVDVVADARTWTPPWPADLVICCEVLEHTSDVPGVVAAARAMLGERGRLVITCAAPERAPHSTIDGGPLRPAEYYAGVEPETLRALLAGMDEITLEHHPMLGDLYATALAPTAPPPAAATGAEQATGKTIPPGQGA